VAEETQRLPRRVHRDLVPGSADRHERQALVGDRPPTHLQAVVPRRPILGDLQPELVQGQPRRRHGDPPISVTAVGSSDIVSSELLLGTEHCSLLTLTNAGLPENPDPDAAGNELADDGESGGDGIIPFGDHDAARQSDVRLRESSLQIDVPADHRWVVSMYSKYLQRVQL
jgi:hypothetical protein